MITPILKALKTVYPNSEISLLTIDRLADLALKLNSIDRIFSIAVHYKFPRLFKIRYVLKTLLDLRKNHFDVALKNIRLVSSRTGI